MTKPLTKDEREMYLGAGEKTNIPLASFLVNDVTELWGDVTRIVVQPIKKDEIND